MKRLLGLLGLTCLVVLTACFYFDKTVSIVLGAGALLLFALSMVIPAVRREKTLPVGFITAFIAVVMFMGYTDFYVSPLTDYDDKTCEIVAVQKDAVYYNNGYYNYELKIKEIDGEKVNYKLLLHTKHHTYSDAYDELRFKGDLIFTNNDTLKSKRIFLESYIFEEDMVEVSSPDRRPFMYQLISIKEKMSDALYLEMDYDTAAFSSSVLLGDKYAMKPQVKSLLRGAGLSHISVVSGLHLTIVALISRKIFSSLFKNRVISGSLTILIVLLFMTVCGFSPSVVRAGVMLVIFIIGTMIYRKSDSVNSIGAAALLLTLINPYSVGDVGMLLSFASTLGIVLWSHKISHPIMKMIVRCSFFKISVVYKITRTIVDTFAMSLCASVWTLSVISLAFREISTVSLIANILIVPFVPAMLSLIALCIFTHYVGFLEVMCNVCSYLVTIFYNYLIFVCKSLTSLPYAFVSTDKTYFYLWISLTMMIIAVAVIIKKRAINILTVLFSLIILFTGALNHRMAESKRISLYIPDTGEGVSVVFSSDSGFAVLKAEGSKRKASRLIKAINRINSGKDAVYIDIPGNNSDSYAEYVVNEFDYKAVLRYDNIETNDYFYDDAIEREIVFAHDYTLDLWGKAKVELIVSENTVVECISVKDTQVLILSDTADCKKIDEKYLNPDIIITESLPYNYQLLHCDTLIVAGESYVCDATAELMSPLCNTIIKGTDLMYNIDIS